MKGAPKTLTEIRNQSVKRLLRSFNAADEHSKHVSDICLRLFDMLEEVHQLAFPTRNLLYHSGLLHDIGLSQGQAKHHKKTCAIVLGTPLEGFSDRERNIVANVARYHRRALPKTKHKRFGALREEDQQVVRKLAALLRIADALDSGSHGTLSSFSCEISPEEVTLIICGEDLKEKKASVEKKKDLFEDVFERKIKVRLGDQ